MRYIIAAMLAFCMSAQAKEVIWLTGLPCAGKTTIANQFSELFSDTVVLDGDVVRRGLNSDLGFSPEDRKENLRRITEVACLALKSCEHVVVACVSPSEMVRNAARKRVESEGYRFIEVYINADVETCKQRDVKGMYAKAMAGEIEKFTGVSAPYQAPPHADVVCNTEHEDVMESTKKIIDALGLTNPREIHACFLGRWNPPHLGHTGIMETCLKENPDRPLLVLVRDRPGERYTAQQRKEMMEINLKDMNAKGTVVIVPDVDTVNWGRGVGYTPREIEAPLEMQEISATKIRNALEHKDDGWEQYVSPGVAEYLRNLEKL